jgi:hypothetical protein
MALALILALIAQDEDKARKLFDQAAALQEQERFAEAQALFRHVAKKYPGTRPGTEAEKRAADNAVLLFKPDAIHGPNENRLCWVVTGDGYTIDKQDVLKRDMSQLIENFRARNSATKEYFPYLNFYRLYASSKVSSMGGDTIWQGTRPGRYAYSNLSKVNDEVLGRLPQMDALPIIMFWDDRGSDHVVAEVAGSKAEPVLHVLGHSPVLGLADEHMGEYTEGPNACFKPDLELCPWRHWLRDETLARALGLGIVELTDGKKKKYIPTESNCVMAGGTTDFCAVCREQYILNLYRRISPIDDSTPQGEIRLNETPEVWVVPIKPLTHELSVEWRIRKLAKKPESAQESGGRPSSSTLKVHVRRNNPTTGLKIPFEGDPVKSKRRTDKSGRRVEAVSLKDLNLKPGWYELVVRVVDEPFSTIRGRRVPWVMLDKDKLLEERARWFVEVGD